VSSDDEIRKKGDANSDKEACGQLPSGKHHRTWGKPCNYKGTSNQWQRHLQNMLPKGRKTLAYRISTSPPGLKMYYELFFSADDSRAGPATRLETAPGRSNDQMDRPAIGGTGLYYCYAMVRAMTRKTREVSYEGDLAKPIREISDETITRAEWLRRLYLLFPVYKIDPTEPQAFVKLAIALATERR
jgi:hypothetical protein